MNEAEVNKLPILNTLPIPDFDKIISRELNESYEAYMRMNQPLQQNIKLGIPNW